MRESLIAAKIVIYRKILTIHPVDVLIQSILTIASTAILAYVARWVVLHLFWMLPFLLAVLVLFYSAILICSIVVRASFSRNNKRKFRGHMK